MVLNNAARKTLLVSLISLLLIAGALAVWSCGKAEPVGPQGQEEPAESGEVKGGEPETITLYFRYDDGTREWLTPEQRTVMGGGDLYRRAVEELIAGPAPDSQSYPVLPDTVKVLSIGVEGGTCTLDVSKEILTDANQVGISASGEALALAAIANTLTEFEDIDRVRLLVEGMQSGMVEGRFVEDFWGHMGLPEYLERNEDLIYEQSS